MGEYLFSCACGYDAQHADMREVMKAAEKHSKSCSMAWDMDIKSLETEM